MLDDLENAECLLGFMRSTGIHVEFTGIMVLHRLGYHTSGWKVEARYGGHRYELVGECLYELSLQLARQLGVRWEFW